jgi:hypothetical protein
MNYLLLLGVVAVSWIATVLLGVLFNYLSKDSIPEFKKAVVDQANNTLIFGIGGVLAIFVGGFLGNIGQYIIFGLICIVVLFSFVPYLIALCTTVVLTFWKGGQGLQWIVLFSRTFEEFSLLFISYKMFLYFFFSN